MITITAQGSDVKIDLGNGIIEYHPSGDLTQRTAGDKVELYLNGKQLHSFKNTDFTSPTGTAEQIGDAIAVLFGGGGGGGDASAANQVLAIAELTDIEANTVKGDLTKLLTEADDLVHTYTWLDGGAADQRISTIVYSSAVLSLSVTETFTYNGAAGTYHVATSTLS